MRNGSIRQTARRTARQQVLKRRQERVEEERRLAGLTEAVLVALAERDEAVARAELRAGQALREWTDQEGLTLKEAVEWCGPEMLSIREATRLKRLAEDEGNHRGGPQESADTEKTTPTGKTGETGDSGESRASGVSASDRDRGRPGG